MDAMSFFKIILQQSHTHEDLSDFIQVGKIKPEDITRQKALETDAAAMADELSILRKKGQALLAKADLAQEEWWAYIYKEYSLPRKGCYTLRDDGAIMMKPENPRR